MAQLQQETRLAIDLEANSMHAYREQVCLIQISTQTADFIIDPLMEADWSPLGAIIESPDVEKVFHAAEYDLILLKRQFDWQLRNLFDTMWAARILGYERYGLASLLETFFGVKLDKRYQKSNWCKRPLSRDQLIYAQKDTHYLHQSRERLLAELREAGREEEARKIFEEQTIVTLPDTDFDPNGFWSIKDSKDLSPKKQAILKALYIFRDQQAQRRNQPHFKIFGDRTLFEMADKLPQSQDDLKRVYGMSNGQVRRYGKRLLGVIEQAKDHAPPSPPKRKKRPSDDVLDRYDKLHTWRKNRALERGVESDVVISKDGLWAIAAKNPQTLKQLASTRLVGQWRAQRYGDEILALLKE